MATRATSRSPNSRRARTSTNRQFIIGEAVDPVSTDISRNRAIGAVRSLARHPVVRNALSLYGIQAASYILPLLTYPYLARVLHAEKLGLIAFSQAFVQYFLAITEYGFNFSATREIAYHRDDREKVCRIFTAVMIAKLFLMICSLGAMAAIIAVTPKLRANGPIFFISFLSVAGSVIFPVWLFQGLEKMQYITMREVGSRFLGLLPVFLFVHGESDYLIAAAIQSGSMALAGAVGLLTVPGATGVRFVRVSFAEVRRTFADGWHIFLSTAAITLYTSSNTFILGMVGTERAVGLYAAAQKLTDTAKGLVFPLTTAIFPHISHLASKSRGEAEAFLKRNVFRLTMPFLFLSAGLLAGAPIAIRIMNGRGFEASIPILRILSPVPCVVAFGAAYATYYMLGLGYKKEWSRIIMQAGAFNFVLLGPLLLVLPPTYAVAITATLVEFFVLVRSYTFYRKRMAAEAMS